MNLLQRIKAIFSAVLLLLCAGIFIAAPENGHDIVLILMTLTFLFGGLRHLLFYATMARHMVGGRHILWKGLFYLEVGLCTAGMTQVSPTVIMIYLTAGYLFDGATELFKVYEGRSTRDIHWLMYLASGLLHLVIAYECLRHHNSPQLISGLYAFGLVAMAFVRIASIFKRTAIVVG